MVDFVSERYRKDQDFSRGYSHRRRDTWKMGHSDTSPEGQKPDKWDISTEDSDDTEVVLNDFLSP